MQANFFTLALSTSYRLSLSTEYNITITIIIIYVYIFSVYMRCLPWRYHFISLPLITILCHYNKIRQCIYVYIYKVRAIELLTSTAMKKICF